MIEKYKKMIQEISEFMMSQKDTLIEKYLKYVVNDEFAEVSNHIDDIYYQMKEVKKPCNSCNIIYGNDKCKSCPEFMKGLK